MASAWTKAMNLCFSAALFIAGTWFGIFIVALMQAGRDGVSHAGRNRK